LQPKTPYIGAGRVFLLRCWFDRTKTEIGRLALCN